MISPGAAAGRVQAGSLLLLLLLLPFSKAAIEIVFGILLIGWIVARLDPATRRDTVWIRPGLARLRVCVAVFLAVNAFSILISDYPSLSVSGFINKWLEYLLYFVIVADLGARPGVAQRSVWVFAAAALGVMFEGLTQELSGRGLLRGYPLSVYGRMTGPYENPIDFATYLMVSIPILLTAATSTRSWRRGALFSVVVLEILCLVSTHARGAWMGLMAALLLIILVQRRVRKTMVWVLGITGAAIVAYFIRIPEHFAALFSSTEIGKTDRWAMWQAALGMIRDRPVLGHGVNTFMANYLTYWVGGERQPRYAHNCYLQVAAETGLVGLLAFVALLGAWGRQLRTGLARLVGLERTILLGLAAGLLAFLLQAAIDTNFYAMRQAALFWVLAGLAVGAGESAGALGIDEP